VLRFGNGTSEFGIKFDVVNHVAVRAQYQCVHCKLKINEVEDDGWSRKVWMDRHGRYIPTNGSWECVDWDSSEWVAITPESWEARKTWFQAAWADTGEKIGLTNGIFTIDDETEQLVPSLMHTKDILAADLRKAGLPLMAKMAAEGVYSNGLSLHAIPEMMLRRDLEDAHSELASKLLRRVDAGEFEATDDEIADGNARIVTSEMIVALAQNFNTPRA
jgi:hypothetical protein